MSLAKEAKQLAGIVRREGFDVTTDGSGHYVIKKEGQRVYSFSSTPSAQGWRQNAVRDLIRLGVLRSKDKGGNAVGTQMVESTTGYTPPLPATVDPIAAQRAHKERVRWAQSRVEGVIADLDIDNGDGFGGGTTRLAEQMVEATGDEPPVTVGSAITQLYELRNRERASERMLDVIDMTVKRLTPEKIAAIKQAALANQEDLAKKQKERMKAVNKKKKQQKAAAAKAAPTVAESPVAAELTPTLARDRATRLRTQISEALKTRTAVEIAIAGMREAATRGLRTSASADSLAWSIRRVMDGGKAEHWTLDQIELGLNPSTEVHQIPQRAAETVEKPLVTAPDGLQSALSTAFDLVEQGVSRELAMQVAGQLIAKQAV